MSAYRTHSNRTPGFARGGSLMSAYRRHSNRTPGFARAGVVRVDDCRHPGASTPMTKNPEQPAGAIVSAAAKIAANSQLAASSDWPVACPATVSRFVTLCSP
jgi:hypothetical protein